MSFVSKSNELVGFCAIRVTELISDREEAFVGNELVGGFEIENEPVFGRGVSVAAESVVGPPETVPLL